MIRSMTGYGRAQMTVDTMNIIVELRSVNHRYFEFNSRVPRNYGFLDEKLKSFIGSLVARGKVECYVSVENLEDSEVEILVNHSLAGSYINALNELAERNDLALRDDLVISTLARNNDIFAVHKQEADEAPTVSSESVGNHSRSYAVVNRSFDERRREKLVGAKIYLHGTGLLYGGLK